VTPLSPQLQRKRIDEGCGENEHTDKKEKEKAVKVKEAKKESTTVQYYKEAKAVKVRKEPREANEVKVVLVATVVARVSTRSVRILISESFMMVDTLSTTPAANKRAVGAITWLEREGKAKGVS